MATVNTVLGTIDSSEMGFTLPHEHLIDSSAGIRISYGELELRDRALDMAIEDFSKAKAGGVDTVFEVSPMDLGRDVASDEGGFRSYRRQLRLLYRLLAGHPP